MSEPETTDEYVIADKNGRLVGGLITVAKAAHTIAFWDAEWPDRAPHRLMTRQVTAWRDARSGPR